jgi:hypothetical protein
MPSRLRNREAILIRSQGFHAAFLKHSVYRHFCPHREFFATLSVSLSVVKCVVSKPSILFGDGELVGWYNPAFDFSNLSARLDRH